MKSIEALVEAFRNGGPILCITFLAYLGGSSAGIISNTISSISNY